MENLLAFSVMALMMSMLPGADTVLIMKNTLAHGVKAGRFTILGMATGLTFWTVVAVLGLSVVIAKSVILFSIIKYVGAAYLVYLGLQTLFTKKTFSVEQLHVRNEQTLSEHSAKIYKHTYLQGMISNMFNPKTVIVYITFMPQFIQLNDNVNEQLLTLGFLLTGIAVSWFLFVVYLVDYVKKWLQQSHFQKVFQKATGFLLMGFGIKTAL